MAALASVVILGGIWVGVRLATSGAARLPDVCTVRLLTGGTKFELAFPQAQNAAIIAAVALHDGLSDHAVTVALAAALQESKLYNLPYGDLDSVGLFQQRPSQGWGTKSQLLNPIYATSAFYQRLAQVPRWQSLPVTVAAQSVQRSGAPDAYATWESVARAIAVALTGQVPMGLTCHITRFEGAAPSNTALAAAADDELGPGLLGAAVQEKLGWRVATWAVAHAWAYHLTAVAFAGKEWTARSGRWQTGGALTKNSPPDRVVIGR